ncbi:MAG: hypothetical protein AAF986_04570 [Pseudomonadota bacterium]
MGVRFAHIQLLSILLLCVPYTVNAEMAANQEAVDILYSTKIAGIGFSSSVGEIKDALSKHQYQMDCEYTERSSTPGTKLGKATTPDKLYQNWLCQYTNGMKHKWLQVNVVNGVVYAISYRASMVTSLDDRDIFTYYRNTNQKLLSAGAVHDDRNFVFTARDEGATYGYRDQSLTAKFLTSCHGNPSAVELNANLKEFIAQKILNIDVKYRREPCL